jgi:hypothetical protein
VDSVAELAAGRLSKVISFSEYSRVTQWFPCRGTTKTATPKSSVIIRLLEVQIGRAEFLYRQTNKEFDAGRVTGLKEAYTLAKTFCDDPPTSPPDCGEDNR